MAENFPNLWKETDTQIHEAAKVSNKMNPNRPTPTHIIIKSSKVKDKGWMLKAARKKQSVMHKVTSIWPWAHFSAETFQAKREWHNIFKVLKENKQTKKNPQNCQPEFFRIEGDKEFYT